jgi:hypothetical protein
VKNITVSLPDDIHRRARIKAAEQDTSVSAMVRDFLMSLGAEESDFDRRKRLQDDVLGTVGSFSASDRLKRDEVHARSNKLE